MGGVNFPNEIRSISISDDGFEQNYEEFQLLSFEVVLQIHFLSKEKSRVKL